MGDNVSSAIDPTVKALAPEWLVQCYAALA